MRIKRYIFFALLLMIMVGAAAYYELGEALYTVEILGIPVTLPVVVWLLLPMFVMFLASFFHMSYYSFINYMTIKRYKKDYQTMVDATAEALLWEPKEHNYRSIEAKNLGRVIDKAQITLKNFKIPTKEEKLKKVLEYIKDIQNGIYVEIEGYNLTPKNPLLVKNMLNRLKEEPTFSGVILKRCDDYPKELCKRALEVYMDFTDIAKIKEYAKVFDKELLFKLIKKAKIKDGFLLSYTDIIFILQEAKLKMGVCDYIELARAVKELFSPDERLKFFEILKNEDEKGEGAYLYTLFDLEMIEKAKEFLEMVGESEFKNFKAYLELKELGRNYDLDMFVC